jgi:translocation and assembly module TamA
MYALARLTRRLVASLVLLVLGIGAAPAQEAVPYEVEIVGVTDETLRGLLEQSSQLVELKDRPPESPARLRARADADVERLGKTLRSQGYYDATVAAELDADQRPVPVRLKVETGQVYTLEEFTTRFVGDHTVPAETMPTWQALGIARGQPALATAILDAESALVTHLQQHGYPLAKRAGHDAVIFRDRHALEVVVEVDAGPQARFGTVRVAGLDRVEIAVVRRLIPWRTGEAYDLRKVQQAHRALVADPLFETVAVTPAETVNPDGHIDIAVDVTEADRRSIGAGVSYSTDVGPGASVFWEHRNLFGEGETLRLSLSGALDEQVAAANYRDASLSDGRYTFLGDLTLANRQLEAYDERSLALATALETSIGEHWKVRGGPAFELLSTEGETDEEAQEFFLVGLPLGLSRDDTDDRLNPTRGSRLQFDVAPYAGVGTRYINFLSASAAGSAYLGLDPGGRFVLAGRGKVGIVYGEPTEDLPANKRFYAGGGGSIRGYEFQTVGPLDSDGDPTGGRSLIELSAELRVRVTETIGIVPFVDAGTVSDSEYPSLEEELQYAAGIGVRYYTAIGPLRADVAFPLNRRDIDDRFQFYVSIGQAF